MAKKYSQLDKEHIGFINSQHIYFVASAGEEGFVNVSPKGMDSLRVINETKVLWLNLTGSGNETAAHVLENERMTIMFCSFDQYPLILRLYGKAKAIHPRDKDWIELIGLFPEYIGARQLFELDISMVQTSCGFAVPFYELKGERKTLIKSAEKRGRKNIEQYWQGKNMISLNGKDTGIIE